MGGGGGSSSTESSGTSQQHGVRYYPEWYEAAGRENYAAGKAIVDRPYEAFPGHGGARVRSDDDEHPEVDGGKRRPLPADV